MKLAIYGAGSMGTILGAFITRAGVEIDLINRNENHIDALKLNGAMVCGTVAFEQKVSAMTVEEFRSKSDKYDIIFLMTKQLDNKAVVTELKDHMAEDGVIVTLQNGLPEPKIAEIVGEDHVLGCTVAWGATMLGAGVCQLTSEPDSLTFALGNYGSRKNVHYDDVKELLQKMGKVDDDNNLIGNRWTKLLINASFSGMSAVLGCTFGEAASNPTSRRAVLAIIKECIDICKAGGIKMEPVQGKDPVSLFDYRTPIKKAVSYFILPFAIRKHAWLKASMLQDLEKGKTTEVDAINGVVSEYGRKYGVPTPVNDKVVEIIHAIERGERKFGWENLSEF